MKTVLFLLSLAAISTACQAAPESATLAKAFECKASPAEVLNVLRTASVSTKGTDTALKTPIMVYGATVSKVVAHIQPGVLTLFAYVPVASVASLAKKAGLKHWEGEDGAGYSKQLATGRDLTMDDTSHEGGFVALQCTIDT